MTDMMGQAMVKEEPMDPDSTTGSAPKKKPGRPRKLKQEKITEHVTVTKKRKIDRFKGMSEEEVLTRLLPDHLAPNLDIVIVGINPGLYAAFVGHHYAGPGNHFWKCLYLSGLIPEQMNAMQDYKLLDYGIGFTNIVARTTRGSADLSRKEIKQGAEILTEKLLKYKPKIAVFNGKGIYEVFVGHKNFYFGKQPEPLPGTETAVFVMPSSSARCSQLPRAVDKVPFYEALKKFRDHINGKLPDLQESEITFPDLELKTAKKEPKQEPGEYPGELDPNMQMNMLAENGLSQLLSGQYQIYPHNGAVNINNTTSLQSSTSQPLLPQNQQQSSHIPAGDQGMVQVKQEPGVTESPQQMAQIKQEPVSLECLVPSSSPSTTAAVQVKQEPGIVESSTSSSQSEAGKYVQYEQPSSSSSQSNFLSGLYGLVNQVASQQVGSAYGIVKSRSRPLQFNDALCGIVRDDSVIDLEVTPPTGSRPQSVDSTESQPQGKKGKSRGRKSKASSTTSAFSQSSNSPNSTMSGMSPVNMSQNMSNPQCSTANQVPASQPVQPFTHYMPNQNQAFNNQPYTTYGNMPYFPHPPVTSYGQSFPPMGGDFQPQSFTQLMNDDLGSFGSVPQSYNGFVPPNSQGAMSQNTYQNNMANGQSANGYNPNMQIKQEKPDS